MIEAFACSRSLLLEQQNSTGLEVSLAMTGEKEDVRSGCQYQDSQGHRLGRSEGLSGGHLCWVSWWEGKLRVSVLFGKRSLGDFPNCEIWMSMKGARKQNTTTEYTLKVKRTIDIGQSPGVMCFRLA